MTRTEAHRLLDAARAGADISTRDITAALRVTGDIDEDHPLRQVLRPGGAWERRREIGTVQLLRVPPFDEVAS